MNCSSFLCYSKVTRAPIAEKVEQLGLEFRKMRDQTFDVAMNTAGKTNATMVWLV